MAQLKGFKFVTTLALAFKKTQREAKTEYDNFCSNSKTEILIDESNSDDVFQSIYIAIITNLQNSLGKDSDWIIDSIIDHTVSISKYNLSAGSS